MFMSKEFSWWLSGTTIVAFATHFSGEDVLTCIMALTGVWYVIFAGQGRRIAFLPGAVNILFSTVPKKALQKGFSAGCKLKRVIPRSSECTLSAERIYY
jgi:nicotinamide riboside transporter PnuC